MAMVVSDNGSELVAKKLSFLALPLELRLDVYSRCEPVGLLTLTHTCRTMYMDINTSWRLIRAVCDTHFENRSFWHEVSTTASHRMLPEGSLPLIIPAIAYESFKDADETGTASTFNKLYGANSRDGREASLGTKIGWPWYFCECCKKIKKTKDFYGAFKNCGDCIDLTR
ncbi:hypothetical protein BJ508DRAFT_333543 [Ascobolus immersus RN42]|uniref:F-box domain-containing protein n=1 Tax=Ascobolus immersus RN42 TaxID=1160509 RepID=A0A3N4HM34_ASCIM|nr:hypothetical protein BJ508DRAFT_333543 [Ascobolus immersus RN42]